MKPLHSARAPGFFYLKFPDHQVEQLAEETLQMSREFFALPLAEKELLKMLSCERF